MTERPAKRFQSIMKISAAEWLTALKLPATDIPDVVIVEGSWWRAERTAWRLSYLEEVRELAFPDIFFGRWQGRKVVYCCAYGAPRTVEIIHLFGLLGAHLAVQIGTCGGLQPHATASCRRPCSAVKVWHTITARQKLSTLRRPRWRGHKLGSSSAGTLPAPEPT